MSNSEASNTGRRRKFSPGTRHLQRPARQRPPYKIIAVGVYDDQAQSLDRTAETLQRAGLKANRSFVVQALTRRLQKEIEGLSSEQLLEMFFDSYLRRPLTSASSRDLNAEDHPSKRRRA